MNKRDEKPKYEPPVARDLSGFTVKGNGVTPTGQCFTGTALAYPDVCGDGYQPNVGECFPFGEAVSHLCSPTGLSPEQGQCTSGNIATEGCISGGAP